MDSIVKRQEMRFGGPAGRPRVAWWNPSPDATSAAAEVRIHPKVTLDNVLTLVLTLHISGHLGSIGSYVFYVHGMHVASSLPSLPSWHGQYMINIWTWTTCFDHVSTGCCCERHIRPRLFGLPSLHFYAKYTVDWTYLIGLGPRWPQSHNMTPVTG
jgi:hypothetical protein